MNLYVYNVEEMRNALLGTVEVSEEKEPGRIDLKQGYCNSDDVSYPWYNISWASLISLTYPSAALWHRKIHELIYPSLFQRIDPTEADYFIVPLSILYGDDHTPKRFLIEFEEKILSEFCYRLPYWHYHKNRHVFFVIGDSYRGPNIFKESILFRSSCHKNSNDFPLHFDVLLDRSRANTPISKCENKCAFLGCLETHPVRRNLPMVSTRIAGNVIFESTPNFFYHLPEDTQKLMQSKWIEALVSSQFILAPRGCGLNSIRFFEALSFGRIPVLMADDAKLPLEHLINYDEFIIRVPETELDSIPDLIETFMHTHDLEVASKKALEIWETYFKEGSLKKYLNLNLPGIDKIKRNKLLV